MNAEVTIKRKPDTGLVRPYRPKPEDFRATYLRMGWDGIEDHYQANWRCIRRWINEEGRESLRIERAEIVRQQRAGSRRSDYVLGRKLRARAGDRTAVTLDGLGELL